MKNTKAHEEFSCSVDLTMEGINKDQVENVSPCDLDAKEANLQDDELVQEDSSSNNESQSC